MKKTLKQLAGYYKPYKGLFRPVFRSARSRNYLGNSPAGALYYK